MQILVTQRAASQQFSSRVGNFFFVWWIESGLIPVVTKCSHMVSTVFKDLLASTINPSVTLGPTPLTISFSFLFKCSLCKSTGIFLPAPLLYSQLCSRLVGVWYVLKPKHELEQASWMLLKHICNVWHTCSRSTWTSNSAVFWAHLPHELHHEAPAVGDHH